MKTLALGLAACFAAALAWSHRGPSTPIDRVEYEPPQDPELVRTATFAVG